MVQERAEGEGAIAIQQRTSQRAHFSPNYRTAPLPRRDLRREMHCPKTDPGMCCRARWLMVEGAGSVMGIKQRARMHAQGDGRFRAGLWRVSGVGVGLKNGLDDVALNKFTLATSATAERVVRNAVDIAE